MALATRPSSRGPVVGESLGELVRLQALSAGDRVYLEGAAGGQRITFGELGHRTARWARLLVDLGVGSGETVGVAVADPLDMGLVFLTVLASGRAVAPFNPAATGAELAAVCARTEPRLVISDRDVPTDASAEWLTIPPGAGFTAGTETSDPGAGAGTGAVVLSTSGTTGAPKVIRLGEAELLHVARSVAGHFELSPADRGFNPLPLFHINGEVVGLLATLVAGATLVLDDRFRRRNFWTVVARHRVSWINAVPAILARLAVLEEGEEVAGGVRFARSASAPLPVPVLERFELATGIPVVETYGMTEAASQITANPLHGPRKPGSVGLPVRTEVRVVADDGAPSVSGEVGKVVIRGGGVIAAYASPGYEDRVDADGWLATGDLGYLDEDGYLFLVGRTDDVINRGGEKIYPREVEDVVLGDPSVKSVVVVGTDDQVLGSAPVAYLVVDGVRGTEDQKIASSVAARVHDRCTRLLSRPWRPVAYHVVESLPEGATGKVRRKQLTSVPTVFSLLLR